MSFNKPMTKQIIMKNIYKLTFTILFLLSNFCFSQSNIESKNIIEFESYFGTKAAKELTTLVSELEYSLMKRYGNDSIEVCYKKFVEEYGKTQKISLELTDNFIKLSKKKSFLKNFYKVRKPYKLPRNMARLNVKPDPIYENMKIRDINQKFFISLQKLNHLDEVSKKYLSIIVDSGGSIYYSVISYFFEVKADYTNYFHKRFLVVFFFIS
jgi:hypothetical protein